MKDAREITRMQKKLKIRLTFWLSIIYMRNWLKTRKEVKTRSSMKSERK